MDISDDVCPDSELEMSDREMEMSDGELEMGIDDSYVDSDPINPSMDEAMDNINIPQDPANSDDHLSANSDRISLPEIPANSEDDLGTQTRSAEEILQDFLGDKPLYHTHAGPYKETPFPLDIPADENPENYPEYFICENHPLSNIPGGQVFMYKTKADHRHQKKKYDWARNLKVPAHKTEEQLNKEGWLQLQSGEL